ncbi:hypothetical protein NBRC116494_10700 [Aurantivibrio plasticivorans]
MQTQMNTLQDNNKLENSKLTLMDPAVEQTKQPTAEPAPIKTFEYQFDTTLKHSNATQNVYFSNYFDWQGAVRERWFFECIDPGMLQDLGVFITKQAHNDYVRESFPFQTIRCELNAFNVQRCSFYLSFRFYEGDELISHGYQQIVFANHEKKISKLPLEVLSKVREYEIIEDLNQV